jgi:hypothetical protein
LLHPVLNIVIWILTLEHTAAFEYAEEAISRLTLSDNDAPGDEVISNAGYLGECSLHVRRYLELLEHLGPPAQRCKCKDSAQRWMVLGCGRRDCADDDSTRQGLFVALHLDKPRQKMRGVRGTHVR